VRIRYLSVILVALTYCSFLSTAAQKKKPIFKSKVNQKTPKPAERRKLVKEIHEALKDPQDKELEKIEKASHSTLPAQAVPAKPSMARQVYQRNTASTRSSVEGRMVLNWFSLGLGALADSDGGASMAGVVSWNPTYVFNSNFRVKAQLGVVGGNLFTRETFGGGDGALLLSLSGVRPLLFEAGGGFQYWKGRGGFMPQVRGAVGYRFQGNGGYIHAIHLNYARLFDSLLSTHIATVSLSFRF